ncbi:MAG: hypothetical protein CMC51_00320 [Flavobacteriaceae bacterium]|nr:hypothetical protein [Flavobacteriaceae bacterium]|tara:strand:- start:6805 stop:7077 length:273 start_codon:yes stop_codon:yes gene_type:complete
MLRLFRWTAFVEGSSYILLIFIAVPIKYIFSDPAYVKILGMPHGILFILYIILSILCKLKYSWDNKKFFIISIASLIPFGTFYVDKKYLR